MRKLTNPFVQNVTSVGRYTDSGCVGLHLDVRNERQKYWVFRYTYQGKRTDIHLGSIRIMSLKAARDEGQSAVIIRRLYVGKERE